WLSETNTVPVPRVLHVASEPTQLLLIDYVEAAPATVADWEQFGRQLAGMHSFGASSYGKLPNNFIGTLVQDNTVHHTWYQFWVYRRLEPQVRLAIAAGNVPRTWAGGFQLLFGAL